MVRIDKDYVFHGRKRKACLRDLFEGRWQLIVYHFMFAPDVHGWPDGGCSGRSMFVENLGHPAYLNAYDTLLALVSHAPMANIERYRERMGWDRAWYSSKDNDFNRDMGVRTERGETCGLSVFLRDGDAISRSYSTMGRGGEAHDSNWTLLDLTPLGGQEQWEDSPQAGRRRNRKVDPDFWTGV